MSFLILLIKNKGTKIKKKLKCNISNNIKVYPIKLNIYFTIK